MFDNIEVIKWAFQQGYNLGRDDTKDGVYIEYSEVQQYFLAELAKHYSQIASS